jgi:hypothetical protein
MKYCTETSFDNVLNTLDTSGIISEKILDVLYKHVILTKYETTTTRKLMTLAER